MRTIGQYSQCNRQPSKLFKVKEQLSNSCKSERRTCVLIDMRLTGILYRELYKVHNIPYRYRGKHRKERKLTFKDMMEFKWDLEREEQNMLLLRHPYLTVEQSRGHMSEFREEKQRNVIIGWREYRNARFNQRITITDRLNHYMLNEPWE